MTQPPWRLAAASIIGTSHERANLPCQDSYAYRLISAGDGQCVLALSVADGAGSATFSLVGAQLACSSTLEAVAELFSRGGRAQDIDTETIAHWIANFQSSVRLMAQENGAHIRDYACTLLGAVLAPDCSVFWQVGDGAIVVSDEIDDWCWVFWPQHGEYANTTNFATDERAVEFLMVDTAPHPVNDIAIFSDGLENLLLHKASQSVHSPFFNKIFPPLWKYDSPGHAAGLSEELGRLLASPPICARTDDDKTLILATRRPFLAPDMS